jgi:hypothetical protein
MITPSRSRPLVVFLGATLLVAACGATSDPTPSPVAAAATQAPTPTPVATPRPTPTATATPAPTPAPTESPEPVSSPTPRPLPAGQRGKISLPELGITMTLPKGWQTLGLTENDLEAIYGAVPPGTLPDGLQDQLPALVSQGLRLWAFDLRRAAHGANVSLLETRPVSADLALLSARNSIAFVKGATLTGSKLVTIDGVECARLDVRFSLTMLGKEVRATETQLWLTLPDRTLVLTVSIPAGGRLADRDALVRSIRLHDGNTATSRG